MLNLSKRILQNTITVNRTEYKIKTDFRLWLPVGRLLKEKPLVTDFDYLYEWDGLRPAAPETAEDRQEGIEELIKFYNPPQPLPRSTGGNNNAAVVDFEQDSDLLYAAFMECYGINLLKADLHWHEFLALFRGLHGTKMNEVMGYRSYDENDKTSWEESMRQLRDAWALEAELTEAEKESVAGFNEAFS